MGFSREHLLLMHTSDATKLAFDVAVPDYAGGAVQYFKDWSRSKSGAGLVVRGTNKRSFLGYVFLDSSASGTVVYDAVTYTLGTPAMLEACFTKTDLKAKSYEDSAFWNAEVLSVAYDPRVVFEYNGTQRICEFRMEEK